MPESQIKVLLISGYGRSGSTLLDKLLGNIDGFVSAGELNDIWERSIGRNEICECKKLFRECDFWKKVMEEGFGKDWEIDGNYFHDLMTRVCHPVHFVQLAGLRKWGGRLKKDVEEYSAELFKLYKGIHEASGGKVIVDSSKNPFHGMMVKALPGVDVKVLHLVRDSRAVSFSWSRRPKFLPEQGKRLPSRGYLRTCIAWIISNVFAEILGRNVSGYTVLQYEHLADNVEGSLKDVLSKLGFGDPVLSFIDGDKCNFETHHMVAGNPIRFNNGEIVVRLDKEWRDLSFVAKTYIRIMTWPWLMRYGYRTS